MTIEVEMPLKKSNPQYLNIMNDLFLNLITKTVRANLGFYNFKFIFTL